MKFELVSYSRITSEEPNLKAKITEPSSKPFSNVKSASFGASKVTQLIKFCGLTSLLASVGGNVYLSSKISLIPLKEPQAQDNKLNIFVYETDGDTEVAGRILNNISKPNQIHPKMRLLESARDLPGVNVRQLGKNSVFSGFSTKWSWVMQELTAPYLHDDDVVVVCDNRDVLLNIEEGSSNTKPVDQFRDYISKINSEHESAVLISAEEGCCVGALTYAKPGDFFDDFGNRTGRACSSGQGNCQWKYVTKAQDAAREFNQADLSAYSTPWISFQEAIARERLGNMKPEEVKGVELIKNFILNMGLIAGKKKDIISFIKALDLKASEDDQAVATDYFYRFPQKIVLDYVGNAFGNNDWKSREGCKFTTMSNTGQLQHKETGTTPLFLHYPGFNSRPEHKDCLYRDAALLGHDTEGLN